MPVVHVNPRRKVGGSLVWRLAGPDAVPLPKGRLDAAFGLAVGLGRAGPSPDMPDSGLLACVGERPGHAARAVASRHPADGDPEATITSHRDPGAPGGALSLLVQEPPAGDARGVSGPDVGTLAADPLAPRPVVGDATPAPLEANGPLDACGSCRPGGRAGSGGRLSHLANDQSDNPPYK